MVAVGETILIAASLQQLGCFRAISAAIAKFTPPPEIRNRCTKERVNGENLASIPKSGPEIKNRCTQECINRQNPTSIPKSGPEIKNRCTQERVNGENLVLS